MFNLISIEQNIENLEKRTKELTIENSNLSRLYSLMMGELKLTPEQIRQFFSNPENFTKEEWEEISSQKQQLNEKLERDLQQMIDAKTKKRRSKSDAPKPHWVLMR